MLPVQEIIEGWFNDAFQSDSIERLAIRRIIICLKPDGEEPHCRFYNPDGILGAKCDACGCPLKKKTKSRTSKCPKEKW